MFTGIVEEVGTVDAVGARMKVLCRLVLDGSQPGSSIAVNGTCLTATRLDEDGFWADLSPETLARTNLGDLKPRALVNLERPVAVGDRLSGHIVQGHVDGTVELVSLEELREGNWWLRVRVAKNFEPYLILKGSVTIDGISLTIAGLDRGVLSVAIIPHTYAHTALRNRAVGDRLNLEVDMIAKYVEKIMQGWGKL